MSDQPRDFTRPPAPDSQPGPEPDDDDPFDWGSDDKDSGGCLWAMFVIGLFLVVIIGKRLGFDWIVTVPALLFVGLIAWTVISHFSAKNLKELATLPSALLLFYGIAAFVSPAVAEYVVPESWPWPLSKEAKVQVLPDDRRVAAVEGVGRVQVYDASGNYLNGWYTHSTGGSLELLGPDLSVGESTILVSGAGKDRGLVLYDPDGRVLREEPRPDYFKGKSQGRFETMSFQTPWYLWPLVSPPRGWLVGLAGMLSLGAIQFLASRGQREEEESPPTPELSQVQGQSGRGCFMAVFITLVGLALAWWWFDLDHNIMVPIIIMVAWGGIFGLIIFRKFKNIQAERPAREAGSSGGPAGPGFSPGPDQVWSNRFRKIAREVGTDGGPAKPGMSLDQAWSKRFGGAVRKTKAPADHSYRGLAVMIVAALIGLYGAAGFVLPAFLASSIVPADWEWPMPRQSSVLELQDGRRVGVQSSAHRVQVYDASGNYLTGWYLSNNGDILGPGPAGLAEPESIEVQVSDQKITFDLQGRELRREELPDYSPLPTTGKFVEMEFSTPFFLLPLTNPILCWFMGLVGMIGVGSARIRPVRVVNSHRNF